MKVLFCKISSMKFYKGHMPDDVPRFGGQFVDQYGYGHEEYNFLPVHMEHEQPAKCMGFVEPKSNRGMRNTIHIEKIAGCEAYCHEEVVSDVLVIWCAKREIGMTRSGAPKYGITVVGWYKNARVWRSLQGWLLQTEDGEEERVYNVTADAKDCVLLPDGQRNWHGWNVPLSKNTKSYGFGQSMVWYASEPEARAFVVQLVKTINDYQGENWLDRFQE